VTITAPHLLTARVSRLRQTWDAALTDAETHFKSLLASSASSSEWRRVPVAASNTSKGKARESPSPADVQVHRNKAGDWRAQLEVPLATASAGLDGWRAVLLTPELRREWDPAVEDAQSLEMLDRATRISRTNYRLGWPAK
jgi:hypothetical protein